MCGADDAGALAELTHEQRHLGERRRESVLAERAPDVGFEQVE
jgi:hypothetical protein